VAQALAVRNGTIVEVGATDEILWLRERASTSWRTSRAGA